MTLSSSSHGHTVLLRATLNCTTDFLLATSYWFISYNGDSVVRGIIQLNHDKYQPYACHGVWDYKERDNLIRKENGTRHKCRVRKKIKTHIFKFFIHTFFIAFIVPRYTFLPRQVSGAHRAELPIARHDSNATAIHTRHVHGEQNLNYKHGWEFCISHMRHVFIVN